MGFACLEGDWLRFLVGEAVGVLRRCVCFVGPGDLRLRRKLGWRIPLLDRRTGFDLNADADGGLFSALDDCGVAPGESAMVASGCVSG